MFQMVASNPAQREIS